MQNINTSFVLIITLYKSQNLKKIYKKMSKQIEINCKNYTNFLKIGRGTYGIVYRAKDKTNGLYVAIKEIIKERIEHQKEIIEKEIEIMKKLKNEKLL